jgi:hypothetical protein
LKIKQNTPTLLYLFHQNIRGFKHKMDELMCMLDNCDLSPHIVSKHSLLFHNDTHNYKITGILKQLKFRRSLRHVSVHAETIIREPFLWLAKTTVMVLYPRRL